jgi:hypothetical protein
MKKIFLTLTAILALVTAYDFNRACALAGGNEGIPLSIFAGNYTVTAQGSATICFNSDFSATVSCLGPPVATTTDSENFVNVGQGTIDDNGNSCSTYTNTGGFPFSPEPPSVTVINNVTKNTNYDPTTGTGDSSFTEYTGGTCSGSTFDSSGATVLDTGTEHFVGSADGKRIDVVTTTLVNQAKDIGAFNGFGVALRQSGGHMRH